ncbi:hypothetical protein STANM309S_01014 [Streptomyces tanashiensis]
MRIRIVDAFTDQPFSGNPAGVLLLDSFPDDAWLQKVAAEVNLSETAFAHPLPAGGEADWALRWFTPTTEVDMCGHATLATAHVLHTTGTAGGTVRFAARCGILITTAEADGTITMDFPTSSLTPIPVPEGLEKALGAEIDRGPRHRRPHRRPARRAARRDRRPLPHAGLRRAEGPLLARRHRDRRRRTPGQRIRLRLARLLPGRRDRRRPR